MIKSLFTKKNGGRPRVIQFVIENPLYPIIAVLIGIIAIFDSSFFNVASFNTILTQSATRLMFALGIAGIIVMGGIDLSLGRVVGLAGVVAASMLQDPNYTMKVFDFELPLIVPILIAMTAAALFSIMQWAIITRWHIAPFIASLGFSLIVYGVCSLYFNGICEANPISNFNSAFVAFSQGTIKISSQFSISYILLYAIALCVVMWFLWNKTVVGKHMFAIGGNVEAAKVSGVNVNKTMFIIYLMAGLLYGFGGSLEAGRTGSAINAMGQGYELDAIAACVVGGVSLKGGTGSIPGVALGVIIFQIISYGLIYIGVSPDLQYVVKGAIIIIAVTFDTMKYRRRS